jgi:hypothetical protein
VHDLDADLLVKANDRRQTTGGKKITVSVSITEDILPSDHKPHQVR